MATMKSREEEYNEGLDDSTEKFIMKEFFYLLQISGLFSYARGNWYKFMFVHKFIISVFTLFPLIQLVYSAYLIKDYHLSIAAQSLHISGGIFVCVTVVIWMTAKRQILQRVFKTINHGFYDYGKSFNKEEASEWYHDMKIFKKRLFTYLPFHLSVTGFHAMFGCQLLDMYQGTKIEEDYVNGVYMRLPIEAWYPMGINNMLTRIACLLYEVCCCCILLFILCGGILLILFINYNINTEIRILILSIEKLEERALYLCKQKYIKFVHTPDIIKLYKDPLFIKEYEFCLKQNYEHHKVILRAKDDLHELQVVPMLTVVMAIAFVIACALLIVVKGDKRLAPQILSLLLLLMEIAGMGGICYRGQELSDLSDELFEAFYTKTKWFHCSKSIKNSMRILREKSKYTLVCKAGGLTDINRELFGSIMSSSFSYFNLIHAMDSSDEKK